MTKSVNQSRNDANITQKYYRYVDKTLSKHDDSQYKLKTSRTDDF